MCESLLEERNTEFSLCFCEAYSLKTTPEEREMDRDEPEVSPAPPEEGL